jgi:hypothetical protein
MRLLALLLLVPTLDASPALADPGGGNGTEVLHLTVRAELEPTGVAPDAAGEAAASLRQSGNADIQRLSLEVDGLAPDTSYNLFALLRGAMAPVEVLAFETDADGAASLKLMKGGLPAELDPITDVLALEVRDEVDQIVLDADLTSPDFLQYLVKRALDDEGVDADAKGSLFLKAGPGQTRFRLAASGLEPGADYALVLDGAELATLTADERGRLSTRELPAGAPDWLALESVELRDGADLTVLSTELP